MTTKIITAHEEHYSIGNETQKIVGILTNINNDGNRINSFPYIFDCEKNIYIFFNTIVDMNDYILYGDRKIKRAYMRENTFDSYYDNGVQNEFNDILDWSE